MSEICYKVWSKHDQKYIKGYNKENFLYDTEKGCNLLISMKIRNAKKYPHLSINLTERNNYEIRKFGLIELK